MKVSGWYAVGFYGVIAAVIFFLGWKCGGDRVKTVTIPGDSRVDTIQLPGDLVIDTHYVPKPVKVVVVEPGTVDTVEAPVYVDVAPDSSNGNQIAFYRDTVNIEHGSVTITDTVSGSRITGRQVTAMLTIPTIRETVTLQQPKRSIAYFGLSVSGGPQNYLFSLGADLSLKTKNDRIYSAGVSLTRDNQVLYGVGVKFPIRLRK